MPKNQNSTIHISELNLRLPGTGREHGEHNAHEIAEKLADRVPDGISGRMGIINLRIAAFENDTDAGISDQVADAIVTILRRNRHA